MFVIIKGQCSLMMKNKVESMTDYKKWEEDDDVIGLLNGLKELSFSTVDIQYEYWIVSQSLKSVMTMRQQDKESLNGYYKRFINLVDVAEIQWGTLVPTKIGMDDAMRNKFLTCTFLAGVDCKRYGKVVNELNNSYLTGQNNYPTMVIGAMRMLSHYMDGDKQSQWNKEQELTKSSLSFAQRCSEAVCFRCRKRGHYANECTEEVSDDESSIELRQSQ